MKKVIVVFIKLALALGLLTFLIIRALRGSALNELRVDTLNYNLLLLGFVFNFIATLITIVRWRALVEALDAKLPMLEALKIGFIGFMFNLSPVGIVGGDAIKIVLLAKKSKIELGKATASAIVDRVIGLFAMFVLGIVFVFATGFNGRVEPLARFATQGLIWLTIATALFFAAVLAPASSKNHRLALAAKIPFIGGCVVKVSESLMLYRNKKKAVFLSFLATELVHAFFALSLYCIARGIFGSAPSVIDHFILYCVGNVGSIIPLSAGPLEYFLDELYPLFPIIGRTNFEIGCGMAIGAAYRLATVGVALIGLFFYFTSRSEVKTVLQKEMQTNKTSNEQ